MAKYVIEMPDDNVLGNELCVRLSVNGLGCDHATGLKLTPYTEPDEQSVKNNNVHLCLTCRNGYPRCDIKTKDVLLGEEKGNNNICCCNAYSPITSDEQEIRKKTIDEVRSKISAIEYYYGHTLQTALYRMKEGEDVEDVTCFDLGETEDRIRDKAHEEAWEFAKQVSIMKPEDKHKLWGTDKYNTINFGYSYSEAKAAYDAWKADKEQIRVGDEVRHNSSEEIAIAIRVLPTCVYGIVTSKDELELAQWNIYNLTKTGRAFPEVVELLEKMREEP